MEHSGIYDDKMVEANNLTLEMVLTESRIFSYTEIELLWVCITDSLPVISKTVDLTKKFSK